MLYRKLLRNVPIKQKIGKISEAFNICVYGRNNNRMNKQRVAAVLCASMVLTASPVNGLALTVEASENEAENNTESSGETKENETEEPEVTENPVSPEENQKEVSSSDKEGEKTDSGEKEENSPKQEENTDSGGDATEETNSSESTRDVAEDIRFIKAAVDAALAAEVLDMDSQTVKDFITASNLYENDQDVFLATPEDVASGIVTVRNRLMDVIGTDNKVTAQLDNWYIRLHADEIEQKDTEETQKLYQKENPGSHPDIKYAINISYEDIRTGEVCNPTQYTALLFPMPEDYKKMKNPQIFTISEDNKITVLKPEDNGDGNFYLEEAKNIKNIYIAEVATTVQGISLKSKADVNTGQKTTLKVTTTPENITESYELVWKSSNTSVASVDPKGQVTGKKQGSATITVSLKGNDRIHASCKVTVVQGAAVLKKSASKVLSETGSYVKQIDKKPTVGSEWFVLAQARSGANLNSSYFSTYYNHFANYLKENKGILTNTIKYTEYSKAILSLTAAGKDARDVGGYNLFSYISDFDKTVEQGPNGAIWALLALDSNPAYSFPKVKKGGNQNSREKLIKHLLSVEVSGGGWTMNGNKADSDLTGMALQALAPYYHKREDVTKAVDRALAALSKMQNSTGGFSTGGIETVESCAQVITGLCALGIDPEKDSRFIKGGKWTVENLISYHINNSGFMHVKAGSGNNGGGEAGKVNGIATEQGYYALVAYQRMKNGQTSLYDMSDVKLKKGGKGDGKGTGLATPTPKPSNNNNSSENGKKQNNSSKPGGQGKSLSGGSKGKTVSNNKNDKKNSDSKKIKNKKKKKSGWGFTAKPYEDDDKNKKTGKTLEKTNVQGEEEGTTGEGSYEESQAETRNSGLPAAVWGFIGVCVGVLVTKGPEQIGRRRKKKKL